MAGLVTSIIDELRVGHKEFMRPGAAQGRAAASVLRELLLGFGNFAIWLLNPD